MPHRMIGPASLHGQKIHQQQALRVIECNAPVTLVKHLGKQVEARNHFAELNGETEVAALLRSAPDLTSYLENIRSLYKWDKEEGTLLPVRGADDDYEEILKEIGEIEDELEALREGYVESLRTRVSGSASADCYSASMCVSDGPWIW